MIKNYYKILGLEEGATEEEVDKRYNKLLIEFDPKKQSDDDLKEFFKKEQERVKEAYEKISLSFTNIKEEEKISKEIDEVEIKVEELEKEDKKAVVVTEVLESSTKKTVVKKVKQIKKAYIIGFILGWPLTYCIVEFNSFGEMFELYEDGFPILFHFLGLVPVFLFHMYQKTHLLSRKWKRAYIIMFILGWPLAYIIISSLAGVDIDFEEMFELYEEGVPILFHFLGLVLVFLFHIFKERSKVDKTGKVLDQLKKLNDLKQEGVISKAEYERLSKELKKDF